VKPKFCSYMPKRTGTAFQWSKKNRNGVPVRSGSKRTLTPHEYSTWLSTWLPPVAWFSQLYSAANSFSVEAPPWTPLTVLPQTPQLVRREGGLESRGCGWPSCIVIVQIWWCRWSLVNRSTAARVWLRMQATALALWPPANRIARKYVTHHPW